MSRGAPSGDYRKAGAIKADPNLDRVVETRFVDQVLNELADAGQTRGGSR